MNKRCIVNVATGDFYCKMQERLFNSFKTSVDNITFIEGVGRQHSTSVHVDPKSIGIDLLLWVDLLPEGSSPHSESPYGFKVHAIKAAYEKGYTSILWLDSPAYAVKEDVSPIFEKIEKEGYYAMSHIDPLENWVGETALMANNITRESSKGLHLPSGSCYGFHITKPMPEDTVFSDLPLFWDLYNQEQDGLFKSEVIGEGKWHRHDEAILALCLIHKNKPVFFNDPLFQSDSPECVIKSGG